MFVIVINTEVSLFFVIMDLISARQTERISAYSFPILEVRCVTKFG